jgi:capsular polysaccharide transport system permease protein
VHPEAQPVRALPQRTPLQIQLAVLYALLVRETKTRAGSLRLGYFWAIAEPAVHVIVLSVMFTVLMRNTIPGVSYPMFVLTGIIPFFLFKNVVLRSMAAVQANKGLFNYRQVRPLDALLARAALEILLLLLAAVLLLVLAAWLRFDIGVERPLELVAAALLMSLLGLGVGLCVAVAANLADEVQKIVPMLMQPLYLMSGIFWPIHMIPQKYWHLLLWNPALHGIELTRDAYFSQYQAPAASWEYLGTWVVASLFLGLALYRRYWPRMVAQ